MSAFAVAAGTFAALSAISGKFAFGVYVEARDMRFAVSLALFGLCNVLMWWAHAKALALSSSTLRPLVVNVGTNFVITSILGTFLFAEMHSVLWWSGLGLLVFGTALVSAGSERREKLD